MKKLTLAILGLIVLPFLSKAQQGTVKVTGTLFPQVSFLFNNDDSDAGPELDYATTIRFGGGVGVTYGLSDYFDVGTEFLISPQGQKYTGKYEIGGVTRTLDAYTKLTYLKVPVMLFLHNDLETVSFNFMVGPQFNFLIGGQETAKYYENGTLTQERIADATTITVKDGNGNTFAKGTFTETAYSKFLFGAFMGFGMSFPIGDNMFLSTTLRFDYSFGDVENKNSKIKWGQSPMEDEVWDQKPKFELSGPAPANFKAADRAKTAAFTAGFNIKFGYVLGK